MEHTESAVAVQIHSLFQDSYRVEAKLIGAKDFPPLKRSATDIADCRSSFIGLWKHDVLAAVAKVSMNAESELSIDSLVVAPRHFRQGCASKLLEFVLNDFDWKTVLVETAGKNVPAIRLYEKFGFIQEKIGQTKQDIHIVTFRINRPKQKN